MNMNHTKEEIREAIKFWRAKLQNLNESESNLYVICYLVKDFAQWTIVGNPIDAEPYVDANDLINRWNKQFGNIQKAFYAKKIAVGTNSKNKAERDAMIRCTMHNYGIDEKKAAQKVDALLNFDKENIDEASIGGTSDPNLEPPTKQQFLKDVASKDDEYNAETLISILNEIGKDYASLKRMLLNTYGDSTVSDFLDNFVRSMSDSEYKRYVQVLF